MDGQQVLGAGETQGARGGLRRGRSGAHAAPRHPHDGLGGTSGALRAARAATRRAAHSGMDQPTQTGRRERRSDLQ